mgnify:CR=1 FL=1
MKRTSSLLVTLVALCLLAAISLGLRTSTPQTDAELEAELQGAWLMELRNGQTMEDLHLRMVKIIQDGYFMFAYFEESTQSFYSAGGGTYGVQDGKYSEDIRFHTMDPELVGEHLDFNLRLEGDRWYHEGEVSGETLREVFKRTDVDGGSNLTGAWRCVAHSEADGELHELRERDPQTWKLVTQKYFQWVTFDSRSGELMGCSGGTYDWEDGIYAERINFHQQDTVLTGHRLVWPSQVEGDRWTQNTPLSRGSAAPQRQVWQRMASLK